MSVSKVITSTAYSTTDTDEIYRKAWAVVPIPEGYKYISHSVRNTSELGKFVISAPVLIRHATFQDQIVEVRVAALAQSRLLGRSWIGIELAVTVAPR